jgi:hypothetical protein
MSHRSLRLMSLSAIYLFVSACASVGSQPAVYEEPKAKAQDPCLAQPQTAQTKDACKKTQ